MPFLECQRVEREFMAPGSPVGRFAEYWEELRGAASIPPRRALDPLDIPRDLLPWLFLMEVIETEGRHDYRYRLCGTMNVDLVGRDATGRMASEIFGDANRRFMIDTFDLTLEYRAPTYWLGSVPHDRIGQTVVIRGLFPLTGDNDAIGAIVGMACPVADI